MPSRRISDVAHPPGRSLAVRGRPAGEGAHLHASRSAKAGRPSSGSAPGTAERHGCADASCGSRRKVRTPPGASRRADCVMAVSRALELGAEAVALPSAGNAGSAAAAYGAAAGLPVHVVVPDGHARRRSSKRFGRSARIVQLLDGLITRLRPSGAGREWSEPGLVRPVDAEGAVPGRGQEDHGVRALRSSSVGAFRMPSSTRPAAAPASSACGRPSTRCRQLGWIGAERPRRCSPCRLAGCAPVVRAWEQGARGTPSRGSAPRPTRPGLRVPGAVGDFLMLDAVSGRVRAAAPWRSRTRTSWRSGWPVDRSGTPECSRPPRAVRRSPPPCRCPHAGWG